MLLLLKIPQITRSFFLPLLSLSQGTRWTRLCASSGHGFIPGRWGRQRVSPQHSHRTISPPLGRYRMFVVGPYHEHRKRTIIVCEQFSPAHLSRRALAAWQVKTEALRRGLAERELHALQAARRTTAPATPAGRGPQIEVCTALHHHDGFTLRLRSTHHLAFRWAP